MDFGGYTVSPFPGDALIPRLIAEPEPPTAAHKRNTGGKYLAYSKDDEDYIISTLSLPPLCIYELC